MSSKGSSQISALGRGRARGIVLRLLDASIVLLATVAAYYIRFEGAPSSAFAQSVPWATVLGVVVYVGLFWAFGIYRLVLRFIGVDALIRLLGASVLGVSTILAIDLLVPQTDGLRFIPIGIVVIQWLLVLLGAAALRLSVRIYVYAEAAQAQSGQRVLIVGAGNAGSLLLRDIEGQPDLGLRPVAFLDDDVNLQGRMIRGVPVIGSTDQLTQAVASTGAEEVLVAMPSAPHVAVQDVLNAAAAAGVKTRIIPSLVVTKGSVGLRDLRKVEVEDLLGREPAPIDVEQVRSTVTGRTVAVTGAAGSIGSELCRQVMSLEPRRLLLLEIDESRLYELWLELSRIDPNIPEMVLCDVRDPARIDAVFSHECPEVVLHAAAYKHVPLMEMEPSEAVRANVVGTRNVLNACVKHGTQRFVLISTDKAVDPKSVMGATKALAEQMMMGAVGSSDLLACAVRFGNVLGSRGSVVPIFEQQLRLGGPLTVTHPEATRFFMTVPEASRLVLQAQAIGRSGDVLVLDMGEPVLIVSLAKKLIALSGVPTEIEYCGLRPAEKLHETLVQAEETLVDTGRDRILRLGEPLAVANDLDGRVQQLIDAAAAGDDAGVLSALSDLLPGFADRRGEAISNH